MSTTKTHVANALVLASSGRFADNEGELGRIWSHLRRSPLSVAGLTMLLLLVLIAVLGPFVIPHDALSQDIFNNDAPPSVEHWLGTDELGRDILARAILGGQVSLFLGIVSPIFAAIIGTSIGVLSGYFGGWIDAMLVRVTDFMMSFDALLLSVLIAAAMGPGATTVVVSISISLMPHFVRMARATTLSVRQEPYVEAAVAMGRGHLSLMFVHILPNIAGPLVVMSTLWAGTAIRLEATLSFIGLGSQPPFPSWGNMVRDGMANLLGSPLPAVVAGLLITVAVLSFNMVGDVLRDALDPEMDE